MAIRNGNSGNNTLIGTSSADTITGFAGNDLLDGKAGVDLLIGGLGNDTYIVDNMGDVVQEQVGEGYDTVKSSVSYTSDASIERIILTGSANIDASGAPFNGNQTLIGNTGNNNLFGSWGHDVLRGGAGNDIVYGGNNIALGTEDNLYGDSGNDQLFGELGNDLLDGGSGRDSMNGGDGKDTYYVDNVGDKVNEFFGEGTDSIFSTVNVNLDAIGIDAGRNFSENLFLLGSAHLNAWGNALDNKLAGNAGNNLLDGRAGNDTLSGGKGNDTYVIDSGGDWVIEDLSSGTDLVQSSITWGLAANVENLFLTGGAALEGYGNMLNNSITGNTGNNILSGEAGADTMSGRAGDDTYFVDNVLDKIVESVNDGFEIVNSTVSYTLAANLEALILADSAIKGTGNTLNNSMVGTTGNNALYGLAGNDVMDGDAGNDTLDGGAGDDALVGGLGDDTFIVDAGGDAVFEVGLQGTDSVRSSVNYILGANLEDLYLTGTAVSGTGNALENRIFGNALANNLQGLGGNDILDGGAGKDTMAGGLGNDVYYVDQIGDVVIEAAAEGGDNVFSTVSYTLPENVDYMNLYAGNINGTGNALDNIMGGGSGNNLLKGLDGNDFLVGDAGNDTLDGGLGVDDMVGQIGNDLYIVDNVLDDTFENPDEGTDTVKTTINWTLGANVENLILDVGVFQGFGNALNNRITGNAVANNLNGFAGADTMTGGLGNDTYYVENAGDQAVEATSGGTDLVVSSISYALATNVENLQLQAGGAINGTGNSANNVITGWTGNNVLKGMAGNDTLDGGGSGIDRLEGGLGNDIYHVTSTDIAVELANQGTDTVIFAGNWTLGANFENLQLTFDARGTGNGLANQISGSAGNDTLSGLGGNDTLTGNAGNDRIVGGAGNDLLFGNDSVSGGVDLDTFVFDTALGSTNVDTIKHFISGSDSIELNSNFFLMLDAGALSADQFVVGTAATTVEQHLIYNQTTGNLYYDVDGVGAQAAVKFAQLGAGTALLYSDIDVT